MEISLMPKKMLARVHLTALRAAPFSFRLTTLHTIKVMASFTCGEIASLSSTAGRNLKIYKNNNLNGAALNVVKCTKKIFVFK